MPLPSSSSLSPILAFFLKLTKFAGEKKVPVLEWLLAWATVVIFGLRYIVDYARLRRKLYKLAKSEVESAVSTGTVRSGAKPQQSPRSLCECVSLCPLAHTRKEFSVGIEERWERFQRLLFLASSVLNHDGEEKKDANATCDSDAGSTESDSKSPALQISNLTKEWNDEDWIQVFRSNLDVRREASYLMFALSRSQQSSLSRGGESSVLATIRRLWPRFLELPRSVVGGIGAKDGHTDGTNPVYDISLIVPMYKERIEDIAYTLNHAFENCKGDPKRIQVVIAHVESSPNDSATSDNNGSKSNGNSPLRQQIISLQQQQQRQASTHPQNRKGESTLVWGELKVVTIPFGKGGGRGRTLNVGAGHAAAPILTFLHADTMVPLGWDENIKGALGLSSGNTKGRKSGCETSFPHACAFTMAIDDDRESSPLPSSCQPKTPGLVGAEWLGVLRCYCGLPYGDSVLSFSRPIFDYMGGYPDQPLMEDYEVMDWLRLRSVLLSTIHKMTNGSSHSNKTVGVTRGEHLVLLKDRARCSPRRWKKYGVAYTSLINAICIFRYRSKATTEELFDFYYHCNSSSNSTSNTSQQK